MEIIWIIAGFTLGSIVTSKLFLKKKLEELKYHRKKELELLDSSSNEFGIINTKGFKEIPLSVSSQGLNAIYENYFFIISFHLEAESLSKFLHMPAEVSERQTQIIKTKIERDEIVKIPKDALIMENFSSILQTGNVRIYSKEDKKYIDHILAGQNTNHFSKTTSSLDFCLCLPNGRVISKENVGMLCGIRRSA